MHNKSSSIGSRWHMRRLSPQGRKTEFDCHRRQRVFKCNTHWHMQGLSPQSLKIESNRLTHKSSSIGSRWHVWILSPQGLKTESECHRTLRVFKRYISLAYAKALCSKSKNRVRLPLCTTSLEKGSTCRWTTITQNDKKREIQIRCYNGSPQIKRNIYKFLFKGKGNREKRGATHKYI